MKCIFVIAVCALSLAAVLCDEDCGSTAYWEPIGNTCKYRCTPDGVELDCSSPGCQCNNFDYYYNLDTNSCSEVSCTNTNCVGRANEIFLNGCQSTALELCDVPLFDNGDCRQGCFCKENYCRSNGVCVPRT